jgi:hypothetical protein
MEMNEEKINNIYTNVSNPGGFSGANSLYKAVIKKFPEITKNEINIFLQKNRTYTLFKERKLKFPRSKIIPIGILEQLHCDLADFQALSQKNKGYKYLLVAVDIFTKMVYAEPIKGKTFISIKEGFEAIFKKMAHLPSSIYTDRGLEFLSNDVKNYMEHEKGIKQESSSVGQMKASIAERMIRTLKNRLYKYFSEVRCFF